MRRLIRRSADSNNIQQAINKVMENINNQKQRLQVLQAELDQKNQIFQNEKKERDDYWEFVHKWERMPISQRKQLTPPNKPKDTVTGPQLEAIRTEIKKIERTIQDLESTLGSLEIAKQNTLSDTIPLMGSTPFGWGWNGNGQLVENRREQHIIQEMVRLYKGGYQVTKIADYLNQMGGEYRSREGKLWSAGTIYKILVRMGLITTKPQFGETPEEKEIMDIINNLVAQKLSLQEIVDELNNRGLTFRGKQWRYDSVRHLLQRHDITYQKKVNSPESLTKKTVLKIMELYQQGTSFRQIAKMLSSDNTQPYGDKWHHTTVQRIIEKNQQNNK